MRYIIDRISEQTAVLEDENKNYTNISSSLLPTDAKEGSVIDFDGCLYTVNYKETASRKERIFKKQQALFKK